MRNLFFGHLLPANNPFNVTWALFRFYVGFSLALHAGWPKMQDGMAPDWFVQQVAELHFTFPSPQFWATIASWGEGIGGICLAIGLFTRFSALQLAFQFFIIAFVWYSQPALISGMYYQQLLFWCFVLLMVAGGGRFSIDHLILNGKRPQFNMRRVAIATTLVLLLGGVATAVAMKKDATPSAVAGNMFAPFAGAWEGTLTYTDYQSGKQVSIPTRVLLTPVKGTEDAVTAACSFPEEKGKEYTDEVRFTGKKVAGATVLQWTGQESGYDDGKLATIRHHFYFSPTEVRVRKEVSFDGVSGFFMRNEYVLHKAK